MSFAANLAGEAAAKVASQFPAKFFDLMQEMPIK
jgi:hypothetical protein